MTLIQKLRVLQNLKLGDPLPEFVGGPNDWGPGMSKLMGEAADELERLEEEKRELNSSLESVSYGSHLGE